MVNLKPRRQREATVDEIVEPAAAEAVGHSRAARLPVACRRRSASAAACHKSGYDFTLYGPGHAATLRARRRSWSAIIARMPGLQDVTSDLQIKNAARQHRAGPRPRGRLGLNWQQHLEHAVRRVRAAAGPPPSTRPPISTACCWRCSRSISSTPTGCTMIYLKSDTGAAGAAQRGRQAEGRRRPAEHPAFRPVAVGDDLLRLKPGTSLGEATDEIQEAARRPRCPATITGSFQGTAKVFQDSMKNMGILLIDRDRWWSTSCSACCTKATSIRSRFFRAAVGRLRRAADAADLQGGAEYLRVRRPDHADRHREEERDHADRLRAGGRAQAKARSPREAIYEGCLIRFRPIMMTTMAALLGALPIALGYGAGGEARRPLGLAVVGGLVFSQLMTLYLTPVVYTYMAAIVERWNASRSRASAQARRPAMQAGRRASR